MNVDPFLAQPICFLVILCPWIKNNPFIGKTPCSTYIIVMRAHMVPTIVYFLAFYFILFIGQGDFGGK
jgi:hypothetical protein